MIINYLAKNLSKTVGIAILTVALSGLGIGPGFAALDKIDPKIEPSIQLLIDDNTDNDAEALNQLKQTPNVVDLLIKSLASENIKVRQAVIKALGELGTDAKKAVPALIKILENEKEEPNLRALAADSLGKIGPDAKDAINPLIKQLKTNKNKDIRFYCALALTNIAPKDIAVIKSLITSFGDNDRIISSFTSDSVVDIITNLSPESELLKEVINELIQTEKNTNNFQVKLAIAKVFSDSGLDVKKSVDIIKKLLNKDDAAKNQAIKALSDIGKGIQYNVNKIIPEQKINAKAGLEDALTVLKDINPDKSINSDLAEAQKSLTNALNIINALSPANSTIIDWFKQKPAESIPTTISLAWLSIIFLLFWLKPLSLLGLNELLQKHDVAMPDPLGFIKISNLRFLMFGIYYHPRVLDAWVQAQIQTARDEFNKKPTVKNRHIYVEIPVILEDKTLPILTPQDLRSKFKEQRQCLLIWGEGGSGKTTLACQLAKWAMSEDADKLICQHQMLPILLDQDMDGKLPEGKQVFLTAIRGCLRDLIDAKEAISEEFLEQLLRQRRLLVIVDRFSEMSENTRLQFRPELPDFPVNALIVTSRLEESLGGVNKSILKPLRVEANKLVPFMTSYLTKSGKQDLFNDQEITQACQQLSALIGQRDITVLLAKLYIEQMIALKMGISNDSLPNNVPDLMIDYLNQLNRIDQTKLDDRTIHRDAKIVAWECLKQTYKPTAALRDNILKSLGGDNAEIRLNYLEDRLRIIQTVSPSKNQVRFSLDPLAEYLAALYLIETYGDNEQLWHDFLAEVSRQPGAPETIKGFLLAIKDCCTIQKNERLRNISMLVDQ